MWIGKRRGTANQSPPGGVAARTGRYPGTGRSRTLQEESPFPRKQVRAEETFLPILAVCDLVVRGACLLEGPFINPQSLWTLRRKHLVESIAVTIYLHSLTARKGKETGNRGVNVLLLHYHNHPTPRVNLGLPFRPPVSAYTLALCTCKHTHTHMYTHTSALTHAHTCTHTYKCLVSFQSLLRKQNSIPPSPSSSAPRGPLGPQVPKTQPQAWHPLAFPGF